ncbi:MAG: STAS domain-containing protein [Acidimicrobiales bacterium]
MSQLQEKAEQSEADAGDGSTQVVLPSQADIRMAAEVHEQFQAALEATGNVEVDCAAVERVDAAVLQCIGSLASSLRQGARELELAGRTEPFDRAVSLLGFDDLLLGRSPEEES